jgi:hypothetical protein
MRLAELIGAPVMDASGRRVGAVRDLRIRREESGGEMVVTGIVIGDGPLAEQAHRWGFVEDRAHGPWLLRALTRRSRTAARVIAAEHVDEWTADQIRLRAGAASRPLHGGDRG